MYNFKIAHHNIIGLNHELNDLKIHIQENNPDIIIINETVKIKPNTKIQKCIIHKNNIKIEILDEIITTQKTTKLKHSILATVGTETIQISIIYCPQKKPSKEIIEGIIHRHKNTINTKT